MDQLCTLGMVLKNIANYKWSDTLFLTDDDIWDENTVGAVLDPDDVEDDNDEVPKLAEDNHMIDALGIGTIKEIVDNAQQQKTDCTMDELIDAYLYYYNNDAFIDFNE